MKTHWSYSDCFTDKEGEYISSFIHNNYDIGFHTHSFYELNIVISGRGEHLIEEMRIEVKRGCVFVIPPNVKHSYRNIDALNVYHMLIHRDFLANCFGEFSQTTGFFLLFEIEPYFRARYHENMFLVLNENELNSVLSDVELLKSCKSISDSHLYINAIAKKILVFLCICITRQNGINDINAKPTKELLCIATSLNFIHQNYEERITIEILAKMQNMSRATYIRWFKKTCGCSPHQYLLQYRIKKALDALENNKSSEADIAQSCGFFDVSHLRKALNKYSEKN